MKDTSVSSYAAAGVNLTAAAEALTSITGLVESTYTPGVLAGLGAFGGVFELPSGYREPVLVASTDGVGTKSMVAVKLGDHASIGRDLVNHCVNDILVQGAKPLFFLDYVASGRLSPLVVTQVVEGVASACREANMALLGGETAEMPGVYRGSEIDIVGTIIGIAEKSGIVTGANTKVGDVILGFESGGLQTNGFSLARAVLNDYFADEFDGRTVGEALNAPHKSFKQAVEPLLAAGIVKGMAHITGGGLPGNVGRTIPGGMGAVITRGSWPEPAIFGLIQERGEVSMDEMFTAFNMGIGFTVTVAKEHVEQAQQLAGEPLHHIGVITDTPGVHIQ